MKKNDELKNFIENKLIINKFTNNQQLDLMKKIAKNTFYKELEEDNKLKKGKNDLLKKLESQYLNCQKLLSIQPARKKSKKSKLLSRGGSTFFDTRTSNLFITEKPNNKKSNILKKI